MEKLIEQFSFGLFFWLSFIFIALLLLLRKYAWTPILKTINERETLIKESLMSAEKAREEMGKLQESNKQMLKEAKLEREKILKEARAISDKMIDEAKGVAKVEASKIVKQAQETIAADKNKAIKELKDEVASLSLSIAEKVVTTELEDKKKQENLIEKILKESEI